MYFREPYLVKSKCGLPIYFQKMQKANLDVSSNDVVYVVSHFLKQNQLRGWTGKMYFLQGRIFCALIHLTIGFQNKMSRFTTIFGVLHLKRLIYYSNVYSTLSKYLHVYINVFSLFGLSKYFWLSTLPVYLYINVFQGTLFSQKQMRFTDLLPKNAKSKS